jgi:hypothetical protein
MIDVAPSDRSHEFLFNVKLSLVTIQCHKKDTYGCIYKGWTIRKRRTRRQKLDKLRRRYTAARSDSERAAILGKARQVSPQILEAEFLGPVQSGSKGRSS